MTLQEYLDLRNGSDVRGVASENTEGLPVTLTTDAVNAIAKAFCVWLISRTGKTKVCVAVGYDSRNSSTALCEAAVDGIISTGHDAIVTGLSSTPSMFKLLQDTDWMEDTPCQGALMITASHLPANRNGIKFFTESGSLDASDVIEILEMAVDYRFAEPGEPGVKLEKDYLSEYAAKFVDKIRETTGEVLPLGGRHIIVDAGNGVGGFFAYKVLVPLGADITGSQFLEPDGNFPNHIPNPENKEAIDSLSEAVKASEAELGIIFDTDVDRAAIVDKDGKELNRNRLIVLISSILLEEKPGTIVTDSVTSDGLTKFIEAKGGKHHRFKRGYKNVIMEAQRLNEQGEYTPLAIETSGHAAFLENGFLDDGAYLIVRILIALSKAIKEGKSLSDLIADLEEPVEAAEIRLSFKGDVDYKTVGNDIIRELRAYAEETAYTTCPPNNYEGCRLSYDDKHGCGWALVRMSLHEPIMPINVECAKSGGLLKIAKDLYYFLRQFDCLDLTPLEEAINNARQALIDGLHNRLMENPEFLDYLFPRAARGYKFVDGHVPTDEEKAAMEAEAQAAAEAAAAEAVAEAPAEEQLEMPLEEAVPAVVESEVQEATEAVEAPQTVESAPVESASEQLEISAVPTEESAE